MTGLYRLRNNLIGRTLLVPFAVYSMSVPLVNGELLGIMRVAHLKLLRSTWEWLSVMFGVLSSSLKGRAALQLENLALRHQIGILQRSAKTAVSPEALPIERFGSMPDFAAAISTCSGLVPGAASTIRGSAFTFRLEAGHRVVATARSPLQLKDLVSRYGDRVRESNRPDPQYGVDPTVMSPRAI